MATTPGTCRSRRPNPSLRNAEFLLRHVAPLGTTASFCHSQVAVGRDRARSATPVKKSRPLPHPATEESAFSGAPSPAFGVRWTPPGVLKPDLQQRRTTRNLPFLLAFLERRPSGKRNLRWRVKSAPIRPGSLIGHLERRIGLRVPLAVQQIQQNRALR